MTRAHALFGPSSAHRWLNCPASIRIAEENADILAKIEARKDKRAAEEGTLAHAHLESLLTVNAIRDDVDPVMEGHVRWAAEEIKKYQGDLKVESKVSINADIWGTADAIVENAETLHIFDFKYGKHPVLAEQNKQLGLYAIAASFVHLLQYKKVFLHILQPRIERHGEEHRVHSFWEAPHEWLAELRDSAVRAASSYQTAEPVMGDHCTFCPAKGFCPAHHKEIEEAFAAIKEAPKELEALAALFEKKKAIMSFFDAAEEVLIAALEEDGESIPGYRLKQGTKKRAYNPALNIEQIRERFLEMGVEEELFIKTEEKLLPLKAVFAKVSEDELREREIIVDTVTKPTVVKEAASGFSPIDADTI